VLRRCDSHTAAAAAASCKQLRAAAAAQQFLQVPAALQLYMEALDDVTEGAADDLYAMFRDNSHEANFVGQFPLDGSAAAGADLVS
jgi:hypothetical protein